MWFYPENENLDSNEFKKSKSNVVLREFSGGGRKLQVALKMVLKNTTSVRKKLSTCRLISVIKYRGLL